MACSGRPWQNPDVFGCSECRALQSEYFERVNDLIRLTSPQNGSLIEPPSETAVRNAKDAINRAWADLSKHREFHHPAPVVQ